MILVLLQMPNTGLSKTSSEFAVVRSSEIYRTLISCCKVQQVTKMHRDRLTPDRISQTGLNAG